MQTPRDTLLQLSLQPAFWCKSKPVVFQSRCHLSPAVDLRLSGPEERNALDEVGGTSHCTGNQFKGGEPLVILREKGPPKAGGKGEITG